VEWQHQPSPCKKKFKVQASAGKVMGSVFWDSEGVLLVELLERGATVISEHYIQTLKKLKQRIKKVLPNRKMIQILPHNSARQHTIVQAREAVATMGCTPYLTPSCFHPFGRLTDALLTPFCRQSETLCVCVCMLVCARARDKL